MDLNKTRVVKGEGMFHYKKVQYSKETQDLLKVLMEESKLSMIQRHHIQRSINKGGPLPPPLLAPSQPTRQPGNHVIMRSFTFGKKTRQDIIRSGAYERDKFIPKVPQLDKEKEKEKFQSIMAYGEVVPQPPRSLVQKVKKLKPRQPVGPLPDKHERFSELLEEIRDRTQFLEEMKELGLEHKYKPTIVQEIAATMRQLKVVDKQRCQEYDEYLKEITGDVHKYQYLPLVEEK